MNTPIVERPSLSVVLGLLFLGGAALLSLYHAGKQDHRPPGIFMIERNGERFVYGAHA